MAGDAGSAPRGALSADRPFVRRVFSAWSLVGASVVVSAEAALFLVVAAVPVAVGAAVLGAAALCGAVGVVRIVLDRRAAARRDTEALAAAARPVSPRPAARVEPAFVVDLPETAGALPRQRRSYEDTSTGPMSVV